MNDYINRVVRKDVAQGYGARDMSGATAREKELHEAARAAAEKAAANK